MKQSKENEDKESFWTSTGERYQFLSTKLNDGGMIGRQGQGLPGPNRKGVALLGENGHGEVESNRREVYLRDTAVGGFGGRPFACLRSWF